MDQQVEKPPTRIQRIAQAIRGEKWQITHYTATIATFALLVSGAGLYATLMQNSALRQRWKEEDEKQLSLSLTMQPYLSPQRMRVGRLCFNSALPFRTRIAAMKLVRPDDAVISYTQIGNAWSPAIPPRGDVTLEDGQGYEGAAGSGAGCIQVLVPFPSTPTADQNALFEIKVTFREVGGEQVVTRNVTGIIPVGAQPQ